MKELELVVQKPFGRYRYVERGRHCRDQRGNIGKLLRETFLFKEIKEGEVIWEYNGSHQNIIQSICVLF